MMYESTHTTTHIFHYAALFVLKLVEQNNRPYL